MSELYTDHITFGDTGPQLDRIVDMQQRDMRPEVTDVEVIPSESDNGIYLIAEVSVLDKPHDMADVVADRITTHVCSCSNFYFEHSKHIDTDANPSEMGDCKHILSSVKHKRAANDDKQTGLDEL